MVARAQRPSRLIQSLARWAISLGGAGTLLGAIAMYRVLFGNEAVAAAHNPLVLAAILLSMAFVLAPFVRRTFGFGVTSAEPSAPRTLLDEMRATADPETDAAPLSSEVSAEAERPAISSFTSRLVTAVYVLFGAMLLLIVWKLQIS